MDKVCTWNTNNPIETTYCYEEQNTYFHYNFRNNLIANAFLQIVQKRRKSSSWVEKDDLCDKLNCIRILIHSYSWSVRVQTHRWRNHQQQFAFLSYITDRFRTSVDRFSNRSQMTSKCDKIISGTLGCASCAAFLVLPYFDVICDPLVNKRTLT